jgi:hypothetical protein
MHWFATYDIRATNDLRYDYALTCVFGALGLGMLAGSVGIYRMQGRPKGRIPGVGVLAAMGLGLVASGLAFIADAHDVIQYRRDLQSHIFTIAEGPITAIDSVTIGRHADRAFTIGGHKFFLPPDADSCAPRVGETLRIYFAPADPERLADTILHTDMQRPCRP